MTNFGKGKVASWILAASADAVLLAFSLLAAYALRFNFAIPAHHVALLRLTLPFTLATELALLGAFGCQRGLWRLFSVNDIPRLVAALSASAAVSLLCRVALAGFEPPFYAPASVSLMNLALSVCALAGARWLRLLQDETGRAMRTGGSDPTAPLRNASIADILKRGAVSPPSAAEQRRIIAGRSVMVTGAGGSIGRELARQALAAGARRLVLVERGELALFEIGRELAASPLAGAVACHLADVADGRRMARIIGRERPDVVFHAAAYKHVPMMEENEVEAVRNNIMASVAFARTCAENGVGTFVLLSTDKAVEPSSVMGASKRICELALMSMNGRTRTRFTAVRFGNVLGSSGSVVPVFKEQILRGGPVTVTHPDMERYFMTTQEAASLPLVASALAADRPGHAFVLDMGAPVRITALAEDMIRLAGKIPGLDIGIVFTGARPGEKMREKLTAAGERLEPTGNGQISSFRIEPLPQAAVDSLLTALAGAADAFDAAAIRSLLFNFEKGVRQ